MSINDAPLLEVKDLSFWFEKEHTILHDISLSVPKGSLTLLSGPNGSGKSLLMRIIKGLSQCKTGTLLLDGIDVTKEQKKRMRSIGLVFQDAETQVVGQTVEKDIRFGMENLGLDAAEQQKRLDEVAALLDLSRYLDRRPKTLSGGEKRRLAIAGVLVMQPNLLILDEPFANLDWRSTVSVLTTLMRLKEEGHTILLVSHEVEKTLAHADHVLILDEGTIVLSGGKEEVYPHLQRHGIYVPTGIGIEELSWLKP
ncbi:MAG: ABC transporter ATP-binding protein [Sphaerochaeta sp.]|jgi:biotin transport system ATP-binding protein|nr:energy-coupling factor ABC transporter ATP-binding protein [Sphaerochaeta sp.]MDX9914371.1 ABC transporter ATP-binding protein [Sphaerochaeta sp.]